MRREGARPACEREVLRRTRPLDDHRRTGWEEEVPPGGRVPPGRSGGRSPPLVPGAYGLLGPEDVLEAELVEELEELLPPIVSSEPPDPLMGGVRLRAKNISPPSRPRMMPTMSPISMKSVDITLI